MSTLTLTSATPSRTLSRPAAYAVAAFTVGLSQFASVVPSPLYRTYSALWGFSTMTLTLIYATYALGVLAVLLLAGRVSDDIGRRPVLLVALATLIGAALVFLFAQSEAWLFVGRALQGLGIGAALGTASAALLDLHRRHDAGATGIVTAASATIGIGLGVLMSSAAVQIGWAPRELPFVVLVALLLIDVAGVWLMPETVTERRRLRPTVTWPSVPAAVRRPFALAALSAVAVWSVGGLYFSLGPAIGAHVFGSTNVVVAASGIVILSFSAAAAHISLGRIAPWLQMTAGSATLAGATVALVAAATTRSAPLYVAASVVAGAGWGLTFLGGLRSLGTAIPAEHRAAIYSAFYVVSYGALSVPAVLAGFAVDHFGLVPTFQVFGAAVAAIALIVAAAAWRTRPQAVVHQLAPAEAAGRRAA